MSEAHNTYGWKQLRRRRLAQAAAANEPCGLCGRPIPYGIPYRTTINGRTRINPWYPTIDHTRPLATGGDPTPTPDQLTPAHHLCQSQQGQWLRRVKQAQERGLPAPRPPKYPGPKGRPPTPPRGATSRSRPISSRAKRNPPRRVFLHTPPRFGDDATDYGDASVWDVPWLRPLWGSMPAGSNLPGLMTPPHPRAVGSYGPEVSELMRREFNVTLRWWQELANARALEHDAAGALVWSEVIESTARRAGKSVGLRGRSLWRIHQGDRFGEPQLVMFTGKDLPICKEIHRRAWPWALARTADGVVLRRTNGQEEIELPDGSRWAVRGQDSVYGYDVSDGKVDEAWAVPPRIVDDGLEPATLERSSPQIHLTSTAHRRATSLMLGRIATARAELSDPDSTLLMLWGAPAGADVADRALWRAVQPHWSESRAVTMEKKFRRAIAGDLDPEDLDPDEPDPLEAFKAQYLNMWPARARARTVGTIAPEVWDGLAGVWPEDRPAAAIAIECALNGRGFGVCRVAADPAGGPVVVDGFEAGSLGEVRAIVDRWRTAAPAAAVWAGKSILGLMPAQWAPRALTQDRYAEATATFLDALRTGALTHTGAPDVAAQVPLMIVRGIGHGAVFTSPEPVHVARSAVWAVWAALSRKPETYVL